MHRPTRRQCATKFCRTLIPSASIATHCTHCDAKLAQARADAEATRTDRATRIKTVEVTSIAGTANVHHAPVSLRAEPQWREIEA